jgi:excisionase family DNA binding protein
MSVERTDTLNERNRANMSEYGELLTIEEAAGRLGVSIATARRMASDGRITGHKSGKQWLIDGSTLAGRSRSRRRSASRAKVDLELALTHVKNTDLTEAWVPDVLQHEDVLADQDYLLARARAAFDRSAPEPSRTVEVDKSPMLTRVATLLELSDRVVYQAAVGSFAERVDGQLADSVFSSRLSDSPGYFTKQSRRQWVAWRRLVRAQLGDSDRWLVKTDLTAYFDTIPHDRLLAEVEALNVDADVVSSLREMLRAWGNIRGLGVPQGPNASRILGNLYMLAVDRAMLQAGWDYSRYLDDIRVVVDTKADGYRAIRQFQRECRSRGLLVSSAKTRLLHGQAARDDVNADSDLEKADYLTALPNSSAARRALKAILRNALKDEGGIDERRTRFSLWRLTRLRESGTLGLILRRLPDLAPVASVVAAYLRPFITKRQVVDGLSEFLGDSSAGLSAYLCTWLFAAMLEHPRHMPPRWADEAAKRVKDRNEPEFLRAIAAVVFLRSGRPADADWAKTDVMREHNPEVLRGYAVGLHWAHALDKTTQRNLIARNSALAKTITYLQGRNQLPSLVTKTQRLRVD